MQKNGIYVESNILLYGKRYSVCYYPLCNGGQMVGMVFTGVNQEAANQQIVRAILLFIVILTILAGGISLILVQQIRKRSGIFGKYLTNASVIAGDKKKSVTELGLYTKQNMEQINDAIEEVTKAVTEQANNTEEIMGSMEEFASSIDIIMGQVQTTSDVAGNSIHRIEELQDRLNILESVSETNSQEIISISKQIEEDSYAVGEISKIINAINDIAFQITILSFNASVEAARAGEAGKGFGVVADSIKDLSDKTKASLEDITHIVQSVNEKMAETTQASEKLQKENQKVVEALVQTKQQLQEVTNSFHEITGHLSDIMDESGIIVASKNQVVETVSSLAAASEENAAMSQEVKATADEVISATDHLIGEIERLQDIVTLMDEVQEEFSSQKIKQ